MLPPLNAKSAGGQGIPAIAARLEQVKYHDAGNDPITTRLLTAVRPTPLASAIFLRPMASANCSGVMLMQTLYPHIVEQRKATISGLQYSAHQAIRYDMADTEFSHIGARLASVRTGFSDLSQKAWAERHTFRDTQWNNWEKGTRRIPVEAAEKLCEIYGLTLDFIYRGRRDGLSETASKTV
jgi:hypothetical protein